MNSNSTFVDGPGVNSKAPDDGSSKQPRVKRQARSAGPWIEIFSCVDASEFKELTVLADLLKSHGCDVLVLESNDKSDPCIRPNGSRPLHGMERIRGFVEGYIYRQQVFEDNLSNPTSDV